MKKGLLVVIFALLLLAVGGPWLWLYGRPAYHRYKEQRFMRNARTYAAQGDLRNAWLSAQQTLRLNTNNVVACRILAEIANAAGLPTELDWRRRVAEIEPTIANRLTLAGTALHRQSPPCALAAETLQGMAATARNVPAYHALAAELALKLDQPAQAEMHYREAAALEPTNRVHELNLCALRLSDTNAGSAMVARAALEGLATNAAVGAIALNWLITDSLRRGDLAGATLYSGRLQNHPGARIQDRLQRLDLLLRAKSPELQSSLAALQLHSATNAVDVHEVSSWMLRHDLAAPALKWLRSLPAAVQARQPAPVAIVECLLALRDWPEIQAYLRTEAWNDLEFLRQAFLSQASLELKESVAAQGQWRNALREAGLRLSALTTLLDLTRHWGRKAEQEALLWSIADQFPRERWALRELDRFYRAAGNTRGMNKVYATELSYDPKNAFLRNNLAATSLLLNYNPTEAAEMARALHEERPADPVVVTTYAFALYKLGRTPEARQLLEKLPPDQLHTPGVAAYYALLLAGSGETNKALTYVPDARRGALLPEESALLDKLEHREGP